jgi:hypothetical protein
LKSCGLADSPRSIISCLATQGASTKRSRRSLEEQWDAGRHGVVAGAARVFACDDLYGGEGDNLLDWTQDVSHVRIIDWEGKKSWQGKCESTPEASFAATMV